MIDQASFWLGVIVGVLGFVALGLAIGATVVTYEPGDGVKMRRDKK